MKRLTLLLTLLIAGVLIAAACGGGGNDEPDLPPGDEGEIQRVLLDYVKAREDRDAEALAALFSSACETRDSDAQQIITRWEPFRENFTVQIDSLDIESLEADHAVVTPVGLLLVSGDQSSPLTSLPVEMTKEEGVWKIATCGFIVPSTTIE
jgi:hypothetical protein